MLKEREVRLIKKLLEHKKPITTEKMALFLGITSRTVKSDIKSINHELLTKGIRIQTKAGKGIWLEIPPEKEYWLYNLAINEIPETNNCKKYEIADFLLNLNRYISIEELCESLYYSRSVITRELNMVESFLDRYHLHLLRNNLGLFVEGKERDIRIAKVILQLKINHSVNVRSIRDRKEFGGVEVDGLYGIILKTEEKFEIHFGDNEFVNIYYYLAIIIERHKKYLHRHTTLPQIEKYQDNAYQFSESVIREVSMKFDLEYTMEEILYLYWFVSGLAVNVFQKQRKSLETEAIREVLLRILRGIDENYDTGFLENEMLVNNLYEHLLLVITRLEHHMFVENPLLTEMKTHFSFAFEISLLIARELEKNLGISLPDNEIAFFTMHIMVAIERKETQHYFNVAVICTAGRGISEYLKIRIQILFPSINIVCVLTNTRFVNKEILNGVDFIISTAVLDSPSAPIIYVDPVLKDKDIEHIRRQCEKFKVNERYKMRKLCNFFHEKISFFQMEARDKEEVFKQMCDAMIKEEYSTENIYQSLLKREQVSGTALGNLIAIPHPFQEEIRKTGIGVAVLDRPVKWDGEKVQIVFLLCISSRDTKELRIIMEDILSITQEPEIIKRILQVKSLGELVKILFEYEKNKE